MWEEVCEGGRCVREGGGGVCERKCVREGGVCGRKCVRGMRDQGNARRR